MTSFPSGEQFEIAFEDQRATIVEVGGGVREYEVGRRAVLDPYPVERMSDGAHGAPLIPWPNRLGDGRYSFDDVEHRVALTEPEKQNAIHGFLRWRSWEALEHRVDRVVMGTRLHPLEGYPFALDVRISYQLDREGLSVSTRAENVGEGPCPYGHGQHPYLSPGGDRSIDTAELQFEAATRILTDPERQLPTGRAPVAGTEFDFGRPRLLGAMKIDDAFTDLSRDDSGRAWARLVGSDGATAELWVDRTYPLIELYSGDSLAPGRARRGLGCEPMTCPPDGFASGEGVIRLEPGESVTTNWGARLRT